MRKITFLLMALLTAIMASAVPAIPTPIEVSQPDGTKLTIIIIGDEFFNYHTTADGYTIVRDEAGYFVYALSDNDNLVPSKVIAHNEAERQANEVQFVSTLEKGIFSMVDARNGKLRRAPVDAATKAAQYDYNNFRGLIILVDYYDCLFSRSDVQNFYYRMANEVNYTGYTNEDGTPNTYGACTGSIRDYFTDNSQGRFMPTFDVVGPITLTNYSVNDHQKTSNSREIWAAALNQINPQVDFSQYDGDNDGNIDMIYFIGAGSGSNSDGTTTHLWPHKWDLYYQNVTLDGKRARIYACSTEFVYDISYGILDGIGTICHEFSHVLGLPDLYDTDYEESGGESQHPGKWDIMAGGGYQNNSRTPVAYSLYDRYSLGFANAQVINSVGSYSLNQIGSTGQGYIINTPETNVKFYLENRQKTRWDAYAPGHGMLICRVDSTNTTVWNNNDVNCTPTHNYYVLLRAGNGTGNAQASDAFPAGATSINNYTTPNLKTWNGTDCQYYISNIQEQNGVITFNIDDYSPQQQSSVIEDFEAMPTTTAPPADDVSGVFTNWKFVNSYVTNPGSTYCSGEHSVVFKKPSSLTMTEDVRYVSNKITFDAYNASTSAAKFILYYSTDKGNTWTAVANSSGETTTTVGANSNSTIEYNFDMNVPARYRISLTAGATTYKAYVDNFTIHYTDSIYHTDILAEDISLNEASITLNLGETATLSATIVPDDATVKAVEWSSSDSDVASVDANGMVTAISSGAATITATTTDGTNLSASCNVTVSVIAGDANGDGTINVTDYVATTSYILELDPQPFFFSAADIDSNDEINVCDLVGVAYLALTYEGAPLVMPTLNLNGVANLSIDAQVKNYSTKTYNIAINLSNDIDLTALQMDVTLPNGMTLVDVALSDRASASHQVTFNNLSNGDYRLVAASPACKAFKGNEGTVLTLTLNGDASSAIVLHDIKLSSPMTHGYNLDNINLELGTTAIDYIIESAKIYVDGKNIIIDSPHKGTAQIVMPNGMSQAVTVTTGRNVYHSPASGMIIVKMSDEVKKLFIH